MGRRIGPSLGLAAGGIALVVTPFLSWERVRFDAEGVDLPLHTGWESTGGRLAVIGGVVLVALAVLRIVSPTRRGGVAAVILSAALVVDMAAALGAMPGDHTSYPEDAQLPIYVTTTPWIALAGAVVALCGAGVGMINERRHVVTSP